MALYYDLPVYKDVYLLILKIFEYTSDLSRKYKRATAHEPKRDGIVLVRMTTAAGASNALGFMVKR